MRRVLFVDDEAAVLEEIARTIERRESEWEVGFASNGENALTLLEATPFDAIVTDLHMPVMDGTALLDVVWEKHPTMVRIVMSGASEAQETLKAAAVAHQFLVKPCDPDILRMAIERSTGAASIVSDPILASMVGSVKELPVLPRTYAALREALAEPGASLRSIAQIIEGDVGIAAKVLQLANSACFGLPREIATLQTAVSVLGTELLRRLALSTEVFHVCERADTIRGFSFEDVYTHSQLAARIAARIPASSHTRKVAVMAALLHDIGKLVLAQRSPLHFERAVQCAIVDGLPLHQVERQLIDVSHAEAGACLLGLWGLPTPVVEAVARHHSPGRIPPDALDAVGIVRIANHLAHRHPVHETIGAAMPHQPPDAAFLKAVGASGMMGEWDEMAEAISNELRRTNQRAEVRG